jgi:lipid-A-disaccharide synthase
VVPELIQSQVNPDSLARALLDWLESPERMAAVRERFGALHDLLARDTATLATDAIEKTLQG